MQTEQEINQYLFYFFIFENEAPKRTIYKDESITYNKSISCQVKKNQPTHPNKSTAYQFAGSTPYIDKSMHCL